MHTAVLLQGLNRLRKKAGAMQRMSQELPSAAEAALILFGLFGTTEVVPFQNNRQNEFSRSL